MSINIFKPKGPLSLGTNLPASILANTGLFLGPDYNSFNNYFLVCQGKFADSLNSQSQKCIHVCCFSSFGAPKQSRLYGGRHVTMHTVNIWLNAFHRVKLSLSQFQGQSKHQFPLLKGMFRGR